MVRQLPAVSRSRDLTAHNALSSRRGRLSDALSVLLLAVLAVITGGLLGHGAYKYLPPPQPVQREAELLPAEEEEPIVEVERIPRRKTARSTEEEDMVEIEQEDDEEVEVTPPRKKQRRAPKEEVVKAVKEEEQEDENEDEAEKPNQETTSPIHYLEPELDSPYGSDDLLFEGAKAMTYDYIHGALSHTRLSPSNGERKLLLETVDVLTRVHNYLEKIRLHRGSGRMGPRALLPKIEEKLRPYLLDGRVSFELAQKASRYYRLEDELSLASIRRDETLGGCPVINAESVLADLSHRIHLNEVTHGDVYELATLCEQKADLVCRYRNLDTAHSDLVMALPKDLRFPHGLFNFQVDEAGDRDVTTLYALVPRVKSLLKPSTRWVYRSFVEAEERAQFPRLLTRAMIQSRNNATRAPVPHIVQSELGIADPTMALQIKEQRVASSKVLLSLQMWKLEQALQDAVWQESDFECARIRERLAEMQREYQQLHNLKPVRPRVDINQPVRAIDLEPGPQFYIR
jgi:hypothetical protein